MEKFKLLIVDSDDRFSEQTRYYLSNFPDIEVLGLERNGVEALHRIHTDHPDAVLFDLILPGLDGISLLRAVKDLPSPPTMICCTRFYSDVAVEAARTYGASYLMFKPVDLKVLRPTICACVQLYRSVQTDNRIAIDSAISDKERAIYIRNYLISLGISSKLTGCSYLTEGIRLAISDVTLMRNLSKGLYWEISKIMNSTPSRVERCIRSAIDNAFQTGSLSEKMLTCPSNKEFLNYVLRTLDYPLA